MLGCNQQQTCAPVISMLINLAKRERDDGNLTYQVDGDILQCARNDEVQ